MQPVNLLVSYWGIPDRLKCRGIKISSGSSDHGCKVPAMSFGRKTVSGRGKSAGKRSSKQWGDGIGPRVLRTVLSAILLLGGSVGAQQQPTTTQAAVEGQLGLASFGVSVGFPAYQTYALNASMQYRYVGIAARTTWTSSAGFYGSLALRGYPPVPGSPVPVFVELGIGSHRGGLTSFAAAGAHVPLTQHLRLDLEVGGARVPLLDEYDYVPFLSVGTSYAFSFDISETLTRSRTRREEEARERRAATGVDCGLEPDAARLSGAVSDTVRDFLRDARATYGSLYDNLEYSYDLVETDVDGDTASARIEYQGSATEIATGKTISASGSASARYHWNGCSWRRTGIDY